MKGTDEDFVIENISRQFQIKGNNFVFEYEEPSVGEMADWRDKYISISPEGKPYTNVLNLGTCMATKLKEVPWSRQTIGKVIGKDKEWQELTFNEKWNMIRKLDGETFIELVSGILMQEGYAKEAIEAKKKASKDK